jgi:geranylgeranyl diphosphate synthase, type II
MKYSEFFEAELRIIEAALERLLPPASTKPPIIHEAMRYSVFAGGKRLRPMLCLETAKVFSRETAAAADAACAMEFIHTYSLIHDDLPALDNDDLRRGKPTCHKKFGEAIAILAGDGLLTLAFEAIANAPASDERRVMVLQEISHAAGTVDGMVGGQVADLEAERKPTSPEELAYIHKSKTAALIRASIVAGAILGGASNEDVARMRRFGENIGWAFQVVDDILDVEESSAALGKTAGKDQAQQKATYPAVFGLAKSHEFAKELGGKALAELVPFGDCAGRLRELADFLVTRRA